MIRDGAETRAKPCRDCGKALPDRRFVRCPTCGKARLIAKQQKSPRSIGDGRNCAHCGIFKPWDEFYRGCGPNGRHSWCKACTKGRWLKLYPCTGYACGLTFWALPGSKNAREYLCFVCLPKYEGAIAEGK